MICSLGTATSVLRKVLTTPVNKLATGTRFLKKQIDVDECGRTMPEHARLKRTRHNADMASPTLAIWHACFLMRGVLHAKPR